MRKTLSVMVVAAALSYAPSAMAQIALDLKTGYAIPTGDVVSGSSLSSTYSGAIPLEAAGRWRFTPNLSAGVYFQWNPAFVKSSACDAGASCSGYDMRLGVEVAYAFMPDGSYNPWVSLGTGWEWTGLSVSAGGVTVKPSLNGWEYFNVQGGVDFPLSKLFAIGPYVGYFGGSYTTVSDGSGSSISVPSGNRAFHGWFQFGAKATFSF